MGFSINLVKLANISFVMRRLAIEENGLLQNELGIKDPKHRKKIGLRAMDIVLFGPPFSKYSYISCAFFSRNIHNFKQHAFLKIDIFISSKLIIYGPLGLLNMWKVKILNALGNCFDCKGYKPPEGSFRVGSYLKIS